MPFGVFKFRFALTKSRQRHTAHVSFNPKVQIRIMMMMSDPTGSLKIVFPLLTTEVLEDDME